MMCLAKVLIALDVHWVSAWAASLDSPTWVSFFSTSPDVMSWFTLMFSCSMYVHK